MPPVCEFDNCIEDGNMTDGMGMVFLNMAIMSAVIIFCVCICFCCYFLFNEDEILETPPKIVINHSNYTSHTNNQRYRRSTSRAPSRAHSRAPSRAFSRAPSRCTSIANECFSINPCPAFNPLPFPIGPISQFSAPYPTDNNYFFPMPSRNASPVGFRLENDQSRPTSMASYRSSLAPYPTSMAPLSKLMAPYSTSMAPLSTSMTPYPTSMDAYSSQPYPTVTAPTNSGVFSKKFSQNHSVAPYPKTSGDSAPLSISMAPYPISMAPLSTSMAPYPTSMDAYSSQPYPTVSAPTNSEIFPKEFSQNQSVAPYLITSGNSAPYPVAPNLQSNVESRPTASVPSFNSSAPYPVPFEACPLDSNMSLFAPPTFVESERQPSFNPNI